MVLQPTGVWKYHKNLLIIEKFSNFGTVFQTLSENRRLHFITNRSLENHKKFFLMTDLGLIKKEIHITYCPLKVNVHALISMRT